MLFYSQDVFAATPIIIIIIIIITSETDFFGVAEALMWKTQVKVVYLSTNISFTRSKKNRRKGRELSEHE